MSVRVGRGWLPIVMLLAAVGPAMAQGTRPRATLVTTTPEVTLAAGATTIVSLRVELPAGVHVQAHQPNDPLLIPTVLTVDAPAGVTVASVSYPSPAELKQSRTGRGAAGARTGVRHLGHAGGGCRHARWDAQRARGAAVSGLQRRGLFPSSARDIGVDADGVAVERFTRCGGEVANAAACKAVIRGFESLPHLQRSRQKAKGKRQTADGRRQTADGRPQAPSP